MSWRVVSQTDGHVTAGAFAFGIGTSPATGPRPAISLPTTPPPTPLSVGSRILLYVGIALAVASGGVGVFAFGASVPGRRPVLIAASATMLFGPVGIVVAERSAVEVPLVDLLRSPTGRPFAWLLAFGVVSAAAAAEAALGSGRLRLAIAAAAAAALALVRSLGGHAVASSQWWLQWIHIVAVATWVGGLALVALGLRRPGPSTLVTSARRYSSVAIWAAPIVVLTGFIRASTELEGFGWFLRPFDSTYSTLLLVKVALAIGMIGLGAFNRYRGIARAERGEPTRMRRVVATELGFAVAILGLTGTITGLPPLPERGAIAPTRPEAATATGTDFARTVGVRLSASPGVPGTNEFRVEVTDPASATSLPADGVELRFSPVGQAGVGATSLDLDPDGAAWSATSSNLSLAGVWRITATVRRGTDAVEVPLVLTTVGPPERVDRAVTPGQPTVVTMTLPEGLSIQAYLDPGRAGDNQVHLTAFDGTQELPLRSGRIVAIDPEGRPHGLDVQRFGEGHFVGSLTVTPGRWGFVLTGGARDGRFVQASFEQDVAT